MKTIQVLILMALGWLALPASVSAFYNPSTGRWLNRDPIGEEGSENLTCVIANDVVNRVDLVGLMAADVTVIVYKGEGTPHASVEIGWPRRPYLAIDDRLRDAAVPINESAKKPAAGVEVKVDVFSASIFAFTIASQLSPTEDMQLSTDLRGKVIACCPCPFASVRADWTITSSVTGGKSFTAHADFDGNQTTATPKLRRHSQTGTSEKALDTRNYCAEFPFHLGQAWTTVAPSVDAIFSRVFATATFRCMP